MGEETQQQAAAQWLAKGVAAVKARQLDLARQCLRKALALDPQQVEALLWLTSTTQDVTERQALLERALQIDPEHAQVRRALAALQEQLTAQVEAQPASSATMEPEAPASEDEAALDLPDLDELVALDEADTDQEPDETQPAAGVAAPVAEEPAPPQDMGRCPRCGSVMRANQQTGAAECVFCGYGMAGEAHPLDDLARVNAEQEPWQEAQHARRCLTCDAISLSMDGAAEDAPCPLCRQQIFEPEAMTLFMPDRYWPFKIAEGQAALALEDFDKGLGRLLRGRREMTRPRQVFLPVWLFDGVAQIDYAMLGKAEQQGTHTEPYQQVLIHGVPQLDAQLLRLASRVALDKTPDYSGEVRSEALVLLPNVTLAAAFHDARGLMLKNARRKAQEALRTGREASGEITIISSSVQDMAYQLVLLPVWLNDMRDGNRLRMGCVNGYTGQAAFGEPVRRIRRRQ